MCGIRLSIERNGSTFSSEPTAAIIPEWLRRRGPDHVGSVERDDTNEDSITRLTFQASVLNMREKLVAQPVRLSTTAYLAWNGEVYQRMVGEDTRNTHHHHHHHHHHPGDSRQVDQDSLEDVWSYHVSDTLLVANGIQAVLSGSVSNEEDILQGLASFLSTLVNAEYAFCILTETAVYYGRDPLGRRSLLVWQPPAYNEESPEEDRQKSSTVWELASVASNHSNDTTHWNEVQPGRVYCYRWSDNRTTFAPLTNQLLVSPSAPPPQAIDSMEMASVHLQELLLEATRRRLPENDNSFAILFSGGLDSVVLAALALQCLPQNHPYSVLLINVSFVDNHPTMISPNNDAQPPTVAADTKAALASYQDLKRLFPNHNFTFAQKQADWDEIASVESRIRTLLHPKTTVMDINIATALWFAASACDTNRVLITGMGADEQMGGYGRHRKAWLNGSEAALRQELELDVGRLWERNLGRDDRILSDTASEARFPYLDRPVMDFLARIPLDYVCDFSLPPGQGDKRILRRMAERMGLQSASGAVKRAIQFGSRISHVSDKRRFGSRRKASGVSCTTSLSGGGAAAPTT
jgi:asparagine synthetase B (glutamine-hydrolysing)